VNMATPGIRQLLPLRESTSSPQRTPQRWTYANEGLPPQSIGDRDSCFDPEDDGAARHVPTPAECYGCVDWFRF
jgi:hypothetical protein